jgi:transposase
MILVEGKPSMAAPRTYPQELRDRALRLARVSVPPLAQIARDLGVHKEALRTWVRRDEADSVERDDRLSTVEREELARLRQEVKEVRRANEILRVASVYVGDVCQVPVASSRSMSPSKIFLRASWPFCAASSRWACTPPKPAASTQF